MSDKKLFLIAAFFLLFPYLIISFYCNPAADDFSYAASALNKGYWFSYIRDYFGWNGRYASNFLVFASPLVWHSFAGYKLVPIVLISLTYLSLLFLIKNSCGSELSKLDWHLLVSAVLLLYLHNAPSFVETFYWYTGAITYQLANILLLCYLTLLLRFFNRSYKKNRTVHLILLLVLIIILTGFNETAMLYLLAINFLIALRVFRSNHEHKNIFLLLLLITVIASGFVFFAPGNAGREVRFTNTHQFVYSLYMSVLQTVRFMFKWIVQIPFIASTFLFIPVSFYLQNHSSFFKNRIFISPILTVLFLPGIIFISVFPAYWNMGILGQHRTLNAAYFYFILIWFMNVHLFINYLRANDRQSDKYYQNFKKAFVFLFISGLLFTNNGNAVIADLISGRAATYNDQMQRRFAIIETASAAGAKEVVIENLTTNPATLRIYDITCDEENWINKGLADYFELERLRLKACD